VTGRFTRRAFVVDPFRIHTGETSAAREGAMVLHHPAHRAQHRRRRHVRRALLAVLAVAVVAVGVTVAVVLWPHGAPAPARTASPAPSPASTTGADPTAASSTAPFTRGTTVPAVSLAVPTADATVAVGGSPLFAAVTPDGRSVWVTDPGTGQIDVLDAATGGLSGRFPVPDGPPHLLTFSPDGALAYVGVYDDAYRVHVVDVVDTASHAVVRSIPVGKGPYALGIPPGGRLLYVPLYAEDHLDVVDPATGAVVAAIPMAPDPHWIAFTPDGRTAFVTDHFSDVVSQLDLASNAVVRTIPVGDGPHSIATSPDGARAAVVDYIAGSLTVLDTATGTVVATVPGVGVKPQHVVWTPDGRHLLTANSGDQTVTVVDAATGAVTARVRTGAGPTSIAVLPDGRRAVVTDFDEGTVRWLTVGTAG
jgi:YVTN family beta-propeller protein